VGGRSFAGGAAGSRRRDPVFRSARWLLLPEHRAATFRAWAEAAVADAAQRSFDVVHAHDFTALAAGAALAGGRGVPYLYDTHEFWSGRPRVGRPDPLRNRSETRSEARLGGGAAAVITVGDGVAAALRQRYSWSRIVVVRNAHPRSGDTPPLPERPIRLIYGGRLAPYRDLETLIAAAPRLDLPTLVVGPADDDYAARLDFRSVERAAAVEPAALDALVRSAGLALVSHSDRWVNHRLALPNKLFEAIACGVPVVATDVGELAAMVRELDLGELYRYGDPDSLCAAVGRAVQRYPDLLRQAAAARESVTWESESERLIDLYRTL
jgi:glycosyltransferase involved in cell wall biosynthesis